MSGNEEHSRRITTLSTVVAAAFLSVGVAQLIGVEQAVETFERFSFTTGFMRFIGATEVAGAVGLFLPRLAPLAAGGLALVTGGAVVQHVIYDPLVMALPSAGLLAICVFLAWARRGELGASRT